jgi:hypothetical protein
MQAKSGPSDAGKVASARVFFLQSQKPDHTVNLILPRQKNFAVKTATSVAGDVR